MFLHAEKVQDGFKVLHPDGEVYIVDEILPVNEIGKPKPTGYVFKLVRQTDGEVIMHQADVHGLMNVINGAYGILR